MSGILASGITVKADSVSGPKDLIPLGIPPVDRRVSLAPY